MSEEQRHQLKMQFDDETEDRLTQAEKEQRSREAGDAILWPNIIDTMKQMPAKLERSEALAADAILIWDDRDDGDKLSDLTPDELRALLIQIYTYSGKHKKPIWDCMAFQRLRRLTKTGINLEREEAWLKAYLTSHPDSMANQGPVFRFD